MKNLATVKQTIEKVIEQETYKFHDERLELLRAMEAAYD